MNSEWLQELERPTPDFFRAFALRAAEPSGVREATKDAVRNLTPVVDWAAYLPHIPHGLLGLGALHRLRPLLAERSFLRALATQLHAFAHEGRSEAGHGLQALGLGSGSWDNLAMALASHRPAIAWGEAASVEAVDFSHFLNLEKAAEKDMANVGHKAVLARQLGELFLALEAPKAGGRMLLGLCAWLSASEPFDTFWHERAARRLEGALPPPRREPCALEAELTAGVRQICDSGLVDLLDTFAARIRGGAGTGDLLAQLVLAAAEKQLDARRDLEGKTSWNFVYLARLAKAEAPSPEAWVQAAALVNLFPTDEPEDRPRPAAPRTPVGDSIPALRDALLDAILDAEPLQAMFHAQALLDRGEEEAVLRVLAEAATVNDPAFNHSHQLLAVAAAADLAPFLGAGPRRAMLLALAKSLGNSQGSSDGGRLAEKGLDTVRG